MSDKKASKEDPLVDALRKTVMFCTKFKVELNIDPEGKCSLWGKLGDQEATLQDTGFANVRPAVEALKNCNDWGWNKP